MPSQGHEGGPIDEQPLIILIAGPNGAGKSTAASRVIPEAIPFLNADEIARHLPGYPSLGSDLEAGRILILEMERLEEAKASFAVETTLASRSMAPRIERLRSLGYSFRLSYVWSPSPEFSIERVASRVRAGGHSIPEETIRRRYSAGLKNFFGLYRPLADHWSAHDTLGRSGFRLIAEGERGQPDRVYLPLVWERMREGGKDV
jgi:predicted ABC-type ATPase